MMFACNDFCYEALTDPFTGQIVEPWPPRLVWLDDTCRCGAHLTGDHLITGECRECEDAPACWEE